MADLLSWLGSGIDKIVPGDQSFLHPQKPQPAPVSDASRMAAANIGRAVGYGNTNSTQPYSPPMVRPTPSSFDISKLRVQPQLPQLANQINSMAKLGPGQNLPRVPIEAPKINMPLEIAKQALGGIAGDLVHGITNIPAHLALEGMDILQNTTPETRNVYTPTGGFERALMGSQPIKSYQGQAEDASRFLKEKGVNSTLANAASIPAAGLLAGLDLSVLPLAKAGKPALESAASSAVKANAKLGEKGAIGLPGKKAIGSPTTEDIAKFNSVQEFTKAHPDIAQFMGPKGMNELFTAAKAAPARGGNQYAIEQAMAKGDMKAAQRLFDALPAKDPYRASMSGTSLAPKGVPMKQLPENLNNNLAAKVYAKQNGLPAPKPAPVVSTPQAKSAMNAFATLKSESGKLALGAKVGGKVEKTIYHGTTPEAAQAIAKKGFDTKKAADGTVWFTDNPKIGEVAATGKGGIVQRGIDESKLKLGGWNEQDKYSTDQLIQMGYDGLKLKDGKETTYQIFHPNKLSSDMGGAAKPPAKKLPEAPAPSEAGKMRGLTKGIKGSPNFSPELQKAVTSKYAPATDKAALEANAKFMKQGVNKANREAISVLSDRKSNIGKQEVVNFGKTIQELDAKGRTDEANAIHDLLAERLTQAGQTSQAAKLLYSRTPEGLKNMAFRDLRNAKVEITPAIKAEIEGHIKAIKALPDGEAKNFATAVMQKAVAKYLPQQALNQAVSVWKAGLLSGVKTQGGNAESNSAFGLLKKASDVTATGVDRLMALKTGQRTKTLTLKGIGSGAKEGVKKGTITMKTGIDMRNIDKYEQHAELNFGNKWMNRLIAKPSNLVFRGMSAADQPFWYAGLKNSLYDQAKADGLNLGLRGKELTAHMEKLVQNPTEKMAAVAEKEANKSTLAYDTLGFKAISGLHSGIDNSGFTKAGKDAAHAVINVLAPFTKVPTAFLSRTVDFTPLGPIKEVLSQISHKQFDQRQLAQAIGEGVTGTGIVAIGMNLAHQGMLSGDYPKNDAKEQARWRTEHITANSVKLGGTWISLNYMGPIGLLFNAGNQMVQAEKSGGGAYEKAGAALAGLGQGLLGQSFLQGFSGFSDAIKDPEQNLSKWIYSQAGSVVPNIVNDGRNLVDNMQRQVNSAGDAIINKLPGFSKNLPAKVGAFGEDLPNNSSGFNALNPLKPSDSVDSPLLSELNRLGTTGKENAVFPVADKNLGSGKDLIKLTPAQVTQRQKLVGAQIKPLWEQITTSPGYAKLDDAHKAQALKNALTDVNSAVTRTMQAQIAPALNSKPATGNTALILGGHTPGADSYVNKAAASGSGTSGQTPAQKYLTNLTNYKNAKAAGTLSGPKLYATEQSLAKEAITSKYSQDVLDFYAMSKTEAAAYFASNPDQAKTLYDQAKALDSQLGGTKYKYGLDPKPKKAKVAKLPKAITSPKIGKLVSGLKVSYKAPKLPKMPSAKKMASLPKAKASAIKVTKGKSVAVKPQPIAIPKVPGFKGYA